MKCFKNLKYFHFRGKAQIMYSIFEQLLQKRGISTYKVSKDTGIAQSVFSAWKSGKSIPKTDKLQIIADYFGVSLEYLTGKYLDKEVSVTYYFNEETAKLAQKMFEDKDMQSLFHIKSKMDPKKFEAYMNFIKAQFKLEHPEE